jgi:tripartite-type tricarboxylate transporter receptor subunit TctC
MIAKRGFHEAALSSHLCRHAAADQFQQAVVAKLHEEIVRAARHPDIAARVAPLGIEIVASSPEELQQRIAAEHGHWAREIKALGIRVE